MHGHDSWETIDDEKVNKQVHLHNEIVREVNTCFDFNFISPKVENDLLKSSKRKSYAKGKNELIVSATISISHCCQMGYIQILY